MKSNENESTNKTTICRSSPEASWELAGVSAWRKGCGGVGERPRLYEQVDHRGDGDDGDDEEDDDDDDGDEEDDEKRNNVDDGEKEKDGDVDGDEDVEGWGRDRGFRLTIVMMMMVMMTMMTMIVMMNDDCDDGDEDHNDKELMTRSA